MQFYFYHKEIHICRILIRCELFLSGTAADIYYAIID